MEDLAYFLGLYVSQSKFGKNVNRLSIYIEYSIVVARL